MRDPKEQALLERLQSGDERALSDLAETYGSKIFQLAFRYLKNREDAEEVVSSTRLTVDLSAFPVPGPVASRTTSVPWLSAVQDVTEVPCGRC